MSADVTPAVAAPAMAQDVEPQDIERKGGAYSWYVLFLLFLTSTVNLMDRTMVAALAEPLKAEFHMSDSQVGFLAGLIYTISYIVCGIPIALTMDRVNRAKLLALLVTVWGGATMMLGAATSFLRLVLTRIVVGGAESCGSSTCISILTDYFPPKRRATAIGVFFAANGVGAFLAFSLAGWIGTAYGWRMAFVCAGAPGVVLGLLVLLTLREPKRGAFDPPKAQPTEKTPRAGLGQIGRIMVSIPTLRDLTIAGILSTFGVAGVGTFTASFFFRVHHLSLEKAGFVTGLVMGGAYALGAILGGFLSDLATKRSANGGCYVVAAATFLAAPCAAGGFLTSDLVASVTLVFIFKALVGAFYGATFAGITRASPVHVRGAIVTFIGLLMNLLGAGAGPQLTGILSDLFKAEGYADPLKWSLVAVSAVFLLSGVFFILAARSMRTSGEAA